MRSRLFIMTILVLALFCNTALLANDGAFLDHQTEFEFIPTTSGVLGGAAGAFVSPASWAMTDQAGGAFWWNDRDQTGTKLENWGWSWGKTLGISVQHRTYAADGGFLGVTDWQLGWARGNRRHASALAWRWSSGDGQVIGREKHLTLSSLHRPNRAISFGVNASLSMESSARQGIFDLGIRPFGTSALTFFGDYALRDGHSLDDGGWGAGVAVRPIPGLMVGVKLRDVPGTDDLRTTYSVGVTLGRNGLHVLPGYDTGGDHVVTSYLWESNASRSPLPVNLMPDLDGGHRRFVTLDLQNRRLTYQNYRWFDDTRIAWLDLARLLETIAEQEDVDGVAFNLAGFTGRPSLIWEFRDALQTLRDADKEVVIHIDRAGMLLYTLASVASDLSIDPQGMITLPGMDLSRTYMKDLLDKFGLGFEALQYFDHKTAVESVSRRDMSPADREQRGRIVDVIYEEVRNAVMAGRGIDAATFDNLVDEHPILMPNEVITRGLADRIGRWHELPKWLEEERSGIMVGSNPEWFRIRYDDAWGAPRRIVVVYALGECAMDTGIRGRATSKYLEELIGDASVAAVVLRADSPGGDPLPSDLIADAVRRLKEAGIPVVISQGDVAASGGYWISMDGSEILTTPLTVTGSIGVISGWLWDDTMHEKAGLAADGVTRGRHADAYRQVRYPLLGVGVPYRALSPEESAFYKDLILALYDDFVIAVAEGRGLSEEKVREIAGGRIWMGADAVDLGLCDGVGGLSDALATARRLAGIDTETEISIVEYPRRKLFQMPSFGPSLPGLATRLGLPFTTLLDESDLGSEPAAPTESLLRLLAGLKGQPSLLLLPDALPQEWRAGESLGTDTP